jgi:cytochrome c553
MIRNRAEAMSCGGCHQNNNHAENAPQVPWKIIFVMDLKYHGTT